MKLGTFSFFKDNNFTSSATSAIPEVIFLCHTSYLPSQIGLQPLHIVLLEFMSSFISWVLLQLLEKYRQLLWFSTFVGHSVVIYWWYKLDEYITLHTLSAWASIVVELWSSSKELHYGGLIQSYSLLQKCWCRMYTIHRR